LRRYPELDEFGAENAQNGLYSSASEVICEELRWLKEQKELRCIRLQALKPEAPRRSNKRSRTISMNAVSAASEF
jgi:Arc/MetJ-type ribon-helix-helix transcriptional regulator